MTIKQNGASIVINTPYARLYFAKDQQGDLILTQVDITDALPNSDGATRLTPEQVIEHAAKWELENELPF